MPSRETHTTRALADAVFKLRPLRRHPPSARLIEDLGAVGLVETRAIRSLGRGRGSESQFREDQAERAVLALDLIDELGSRSAAVLVMFLRGWPVDKDSLERAYASVFDAATLRLRRWAGMDASAQPQAVAQTAASNFAPRASRSTSLTELRAWARNQASAHGRRTQDHVASALSEAFTLLLAGRTSPAGLDEFLDATSITAAARDCVLSEQPLRGPVATEDLRDYISGLHVQALARQVRASTLAQLQTARDDVVALRDLATAVTPVAVELGAPQAFGLRLIAGMSELTTALAIPGMVILHRTMPESAAVVRELCSAETPRFQAINRLSRQLDTRHRRLLLQMVRTPEHKRNPEEIELLRPLIERFQREDPEGYIAITS